MIYFSTPSDFDKIRGTLSKDFEKPPMQPGDSGKKLFWNGEHVNLLLKFDDASGTGRIMYFFKPIQLEIEVSG